MIKSNTKRVLVLILTATLALSLAACRGGTSEAGNTSPQTSTPPTESEGDTAIVSSETHEDDLYADFITKYKDLELPGTFRFGSGGGTSMYRFSNYDREESRLGLDVYVWPEDSSGNAQQGIGVDTIDVNGVKCFKVVQIYITLTPNDEQKQNGVKPWEVNLFYDGATYPLSVALGEFTTTSTADGKSTTGSLSKGYMSKELMSLTTEIMNALSNDAILEKSVDELLAQMPTPLSVKQK